MAMPVGTHKLVQGARLLAKDVHVYIRQFRQMALFAVPTVQDPLTLLFLLELQLGNYFPALFPVISVASDRKYSYPVRLEEFFQYPLLQGQAMVMLSRKLSAFPFCRKCLRNDLHTSCNTVASSWQYRSSTRLLSKTCFLTKLSYDARNPFLSDSCN